jgi:hypothetical protein
MKDFCKLLSIMCFTGAIIDFLFRDYPRCGCYLGFSIVAALWKITITLKEPHNG